MTRLLATLAVLALLLPASVSAQCLDLDPLDDGSGAFGAIGLPSLVISEVNPGQYVELFNTTGADIVLPGVYFLCSHFVYAQMAGTVPAGGYATVLWPASFLTATDANGEMMLYDSGLFNVSTDILDYTIWGNPNPIGTRKNQALAVGKWIGANAAAISGGAIHRRIGVKGNQASEYDPTAPPSPENCSPPTGIEDTPAMLGARVWNSPNPFAATTHVEFVLDAPATVEVAIYAVDGTLVRKLAAESFPAGVRNRVAWDGTDERGRAVASGAYLARVSGSGVSSAARVTLIR